MLTGKKIKFLEMKKERKMKYVMNLRMKAPAMKEVKYDESSHPQIHIHIQQKKTNMHAGLWPIW